MANGPAIEFVTPVGTLVFGSLYTPNSKDYDGNPLPPDKKPKYNFGLAVPKRLGETHYSQSVVGKIILEVARRDHPHSVDRDDFACKVTDGDSTKPGKVRNGKPTKTPHEKPGFSGCWVYTFSGTQAPIIIGDDLQPIVTKDAVIPGDEVQIAGSVVGNSGATPGVYLNYRFIRLKRKGEPIVTYKDPAEINWDTPTPAIAVSAAPQAIPMPAAAVTSSPISVKPAPAFLAPPPPVPTPTGPLMTEKAGGATWEAFAAQGWTLEAARNAGYIR